jgi:hypothetical protein
MIEILEEKSVTLRKDLQKKDMSRITPRHWIISSTIKGHTMTSQD